MAFCRQLRLFVLLAVTAAGSIAPAQRAPEGRRSPDVFLITIDTLRADHVGAYGYAKAQTPTLDALAQDGIRFEQAFTASPITNTSHASILTGLLPSGHGVTDFGVSLGRDKATLATQLHAARYHTGAFIGSVILDSKSLARGFDQGFDLYFDFPPAAARIKSRYGRVERRAADVIARAQEWLVATRGPRFAWIHLYDPHDPYDPPPPYAAQFKDRPYDGEIAYADHELGEFVRFLKQRGWYDNALIIVVGDHGEGLGEHGEETHGIFLYDSTLHVPLLVKLPQQARAGTVVSTHVVTSQVRTIDIAPTILDLTHAASPKTDGATLRPLWSAGSAAAARVALGEADYPLRFGWAPLRSVRAESFKYIEAPRPELYDLHADASELKNIYEPWTDAVKRLRQLLADAHLPPIGAQSGGTQGAAAVPATTVAELKALGYFGNDPGSTTVREPSLLPDPKDKIREQNLLHRAQLADEEGDSRTARALLRQVIAADPSAEAALVQLGRIELAQGDYREAAAAFQRALEVRPDDAGAALELGKCLYKLRDYAGARDALQTALKLGVGGYDARMLLAATLAQLHDVPAALDQFEAAALLEPKNSEPRKRLGGLLLASGSYEDAIAALELTTQLAPGDAEGFELLANAYRAAGKLYLAKRATLRAQKLRTAR